MFAEIQSTTSLTAPEKEALEKIKVIGAKTDRTVKQQFDEATAVLKGLSEEQQKQITDFINDAIHRLTPKHHGHGHGHGHNHGHWCPMLLLPLKALIYVSFMWNMKVNTVSGYNSRIHGTRNYGDFVELTRGTLRNARMNLKTFCGTSSVEQMSPPLS